MSNYIYFLVESGEILELAKQHVRNSKDLDLRNKEIAKELGADRYFVSAIDGTVTGLDFGGSPIHVDFRKPNRYGCSIPKKNTHWHKRFMEQKGVDKLCFDLASYLGVPKSFTYTRKGAQGVSRVARDIGSGVGFLWLSENGPFALYITDIPAVVSQYEAKGYTIDDACKNFKPDFDGCRPILKEEWEMIAAQFKLSAAKARHIN